MLKDCPTPIAALASIVAGTGGYLLKSPELIKVGECVSWCSKGSFLAQHWVLVTITVIVSLTIVYGARKWTNSLGEVRGRGRSVSYAVPFAAWHGGAPDGARSNGAERWRARVVDRHSRRGHLS